jgi:anionic cell wall polymer biosynthesis LytR-Cps2A-Psr (LCP) family protein
MGLKEKILSLQTLTDPKKLSELLNVLGKSIDTDISIKDGLEFFKLSKDLEATNSIVMDDSKKHGLPDSRKSLLVRPTAGDYGAYVLISEDDDFTIIHNYIKKVMEEGEQSELNSLSDEK